MHFGVVTAKIDDIGHISHAKDLGFTHCWVTNRQYRVIEDFADRVMARL